MTTATETRTANQRDPAREQFYKAQIEVESSLSNARVRPATRLNATSDTVDALDRQWRELKAAAEAHKTATDPAREALEIARDDTIATEGRERLYTEMRQAAGEQVAEANRTFAANATVYRASLHQAALGTLTRTRATEAKADARDVLTPATNPTDLLDAAQELAASSDDLAALAGSDWMARYLRARGVQDDAIATLRDRVIRRNATDHTDPNIRAIATTYLNSGDLYVLPAAYRALSNLVIKRASKYANGGTSHANPFNWL